MDEITHSSQSQYDDVARHRAEITNPRRFVLPIFFLVVSNHSDECQDRHYPAIWDHSRETSEESKYSQPSFSRPFQGRHKSVHPCVKKS